MKNDRRAFLQFLAASPLLAGGMARDALAQAEASDMARDAQAQAVAGGTACETSAQTARDGVDSLLAPVGRPGDALDIFDLERVAAQNIPPAHWGSLSAGSNGEETLRANRDAYSHWQLRTRRLVDLSKLDMSVRVLGARYSSPIYLSAVGEQKAFHPDGELGCARAAKAHDQLQMLSTYSSCALEEVIQARGAPIWYQLYPSSNIAATLQLVRRAEAAGCTALAVTVDVPVGGNMPNAIRWRRADTRTCTACHAPGGPLMETLPMFKGLGLSGAQTTPSLTWDTVRRIQEGTKMKVLVKGLESGEDAALAVKHGLDGVVVSNHGGRATETGRGTLEDLPEVVEAVGGKIPVFVDGGVRRGTDVLKALALGATAVGIGRPYAWGLGAFGEAGVDRALTILNEELRLAMAGIGARSIREITAAALIRKA